MRAASLTGPELKEIGIAKLRHRKDLLRALNTEGYVRAGDLQLLFARIRDEKRSREDLRCVKHGVLDFLGDENEQFRDGTVWQSKYATIWSAAVGSAPGHTMPSPHDALL